LSTRELRALERRATAVLRELEQAARRLEPGAIVGPPRREGARWAAELQENERALRAQVRALVGDDPAAQAAFLRDLGVTTPEDPLFAEALRLLGDERLAARFVEMER
jgi:hypothetical protein